jgi:hypothetical protein
MRARRRVAQSDRHFVEVTVTALMRRGGTSAYVRLFRAKLTMRCRSQRGITRDARPGVGKARGERPWLSS